MKLIMPKPNMPGYVWTRTVCPHCGLEFDDFIDSELSIQTTKCPNLDCRKKFEISKEDIDNARRYI